MVVIDTGHADRQRSASADFENKETHPSSKNGRKLTKVWEFGMLRSDGEGFNWNGHSPEMFSAMAPPQLASLKRNSSKNKNKNGPKKGSEKSRRKNRREKERGDVIKGRPWSMRDWSWLRASWETSPIWFWWENQQQK